VALIASSAHRYGGQSRSLAIGFVLTIPPIASFRFFSYAEPFRPLAWPNRDPPSSPGLVVQHATHVASVMAWSGRRPATPRSS